MDKAKVAISIRKETLNRLDRLVKNNVFESRSGAIQEAVDEKLRKMEHTRLAEECAKLDPAEEQKMAEEGFSEDMKEWPVY